jgi:hypothetical protein
MFEQYKSEFGVKKFSKNKMEKFMVQLMKSLGETNEKQKALEKKVETLTSQNDSFLRQNQQIIQEVINKNDYTKKLETLLLFILEVIVPKQPNYKPNVTSNNSLLSSNPEFKNKSNADPRSSVYKAAVDGLGENFMINLVEKYIEYNSMPGKDGKIFTKLDLPIFPRNNVLGSADNNTTNNICLNPNVSNFSTKYIDDNKASPNPYEEYNYASGLFGSPNLSHLQDPVDSLGFKKENSFRKNSFDIDYFKEEPRKEEDEHNMFEESFLSMSSSEKK